MKTKAVPEKESYLMSVQGTIVKFLLKLPPAWLVKLSGGDPVTIGERTMDPYIQFLSHGAKRQPPMSSLDPPSARKAAAEALAMLAAVPEPGVVWEDFTLDAPGRDIPVRLYRPDVQTADHPMMVYMHMGGGVIGDLETCHAFCAMIAKAIAAPVLSVDYRLAPEHKFPAGLEDCLFAYEWALKNAGTYGAPAGEASLGGDSMGGNFAAIISQEMRREHKPVPSVQMLVYPATDLVNELPSKTLYGECYPLTTDTMDWFMEHYLPDGQDRSDLRLSPALEARRLDGLPRTLIATAGFDPLVDEGAVYAKKLKGAGVPVDYVCYDSLAHGFTAFMAISPAAYKACEDIASRLATAYEALSSDRAA